MKLSEKLNNLSSYPFHMPGHKRNEKFNITGAEIDITEIDGFDNLHNPMGIIKDLEEDISKLYGSKKSIISVNGSSCCVLSAVSAVCSKGDKIIIARNCHKSVYNACFINGLRIAYIEPEFDSNLGVYTRVTQDSVDRALNENPDAKAIVITSPTYEGIVSEIKADISLIVDAAHGSHFGFGEFLPKKAKGDIVINSFHKTLPCLTQTAAVHIYNDKYCDGVKKYMDIFETSSPSYILLSSVDKCIDFLKNSKSTFCGFENMLKDFYKKSEKLKGINLFKNDDISRIIISAEGYSGAELGDYLRSKNIEIEGAGYGYVILISTVCDTQKGFDLLYKALSELPLKNTDYAPLPNPYIPEKKYEIWEITESNKTEIQNSIGKTCGEYIYAYPPGSPIVAPGEIITQETVDYINQLISAGINVLSDSNLLPQWILTNRC